MSTYQIIETAIDRSKSHNEIVSLDALEIRRAGLSVKAVCAALFVECEGDVEANDGVHEFWGRDVDGTEWRVHVRTLAD